MNISFDSDQTAIALQDPRPSPAWAAGPELPPDPCDVAGRPGTSARSWSIVAAAVVGAALALGAAVGLAIVEYGGADQSTSTAVTPGAATVTMRPPASVGHSPAAPLPPPIAQPSSADAPAPVSVIAPPPVTAGPAAVSAPTVTATDSDPTTADSAPSAAPPPTDDPAPPNDAVIPPPPVIPPPLIPPVVVNLPALPSPPPVTVTVTPSPQPHPTLIPMPCKVSNCTPHSIPHL